MAIVAHDVLVPDLGQVLHHDDFSIVIGELGQHFLLHELYCDYLVGGQLVAFVHHPEIPPSQLFRFVHVELRRYFLHAASDEAALVHV